MRARAAPAMVVVALDECVLGLVAGALGEAGGNHGLFDLVKVRAFGIHGVDGGGAGLATLVGACPDRRHVARSPVRRPPTPPQGIHDHAVAHYLDGGGVCRNVEVIIDCADVQEGSAAGPVDLDAVGIEARGDQISVSSRKLSVGGRAGSDSEPYEEEESSRGLGQEAEGEDDGGGLHVVVGVLEFER